MLGYDNEVTFHILHYSYQSNFTKQDSFKDIPLPLFQFNIKKLRANIVIELVTWRISVLISALVFIVER